MVGCLNFNKIPPFNFMCNSMPHKTPEALLFLHLINLFWFYEQHPHQYHHHDE